MSSLGASKSTSNSTISSTFSDEIATCKENTTPLISEKFETEASCVNPSNSDVITNGNGNLNDTSITNGFLFQYKNINSTNGFDGDSITLSSVELEQDSSDSYRYSLLKTSEMEPLLLSEGDSSISKSNPDHDKRIEKNSELECTSSKDNTPFLLNDKTVALSENSECADTVEQLTSSIERTCSLKSENPQPHADTIDGITYVVYESEKQMPDIMRLITKDLSEPYSIYTYRYFIHNWPKLCFLAMDGNVCIGAIVCKLDLHKKFARRRGYIAMLAVDSAYRRRKLGSTLVTKAIKAMISDDCDEVVLETEITNQGALHLYENLGFVRDKRLFRYYLNGVDALRLKLWLR